MSYNLKQLRQALSDKKAEGKKVLDAADAEGRDLKDDEVERLEAIRTEVEDLEQQLAAAQAEADEQARQASLRSRFSGDTPRIEMGVDRATLDPQGGFQSFGEYALAVRRACRPNSQPDDRLAIGAAPTTIANEGAGEDGGYLIPPAFSTRIYEHSLDEDSFLPMTDNTDIAGNSMTFPRDETTPWGGDGVQVYWEAEAGQATQTKPKLGLDSMRLHKMIGLVPVTEELLADQGALSGYLPRKLGAKVRWKTNNALVNGTGAGQPTGILTADCLVTQAKASGQAADSIVAENVVNMFARNTNPGRAVWLINPDAFPQLPLMTIGHQPVYTLPGAGGLRVTPAGSMLGRPVLMSDTCKTVGDLGDINFVDWMGMVSITKAGGIETATSMHLWFDYAVSAFRVIFRVDAQPWLKAAVSPPNGNITRSPFVTLAARA